MFFFKKRVDNETKKIDKAKLPLHIAIIMDGNGRWAKKRGLTRGMGHREGARNLKKVTKFCGNLGIKFLTIYAFSTENWKRPKNEVDTLMSLLLEYLKNADRELGGENVKIKVIGDRQGLSEQIKSEIKRVEESTKANNGMQLNIALNYGSRDEILHAIKEISKEIGKGELSADKIDIKTVSDHLYTYGTPDPDLLIRTSGEKRISNFLLWQIAYTEFWYTDALWPDFSEKHILEAIQVYQSRDRRFGGV